MIKKYEVYILINIKPLQRETIITQHCKNNFNNIFITSIFVTWEILSQCYRVAFRDAINTSL